MPARLRCSAVLSKYGILSRGSLNHTRHVVCHFLVKSLLAGAPVITTVSQQKGREEVALLLLPLVRE